MEQKRTHEAVVDQGSLLAGSSLHRSVIWAKKSMKGGLLCKDLWCNDHSCHDMCFCKRKIWRCSTQKRESLTWRRREFNESESFFQWKPMLRKELRHVRLMKYFQASVQTCVDVSHCSQWPMQLIVPMTFKFGLETHVQAKACHGS